MHFIMMIGLLLTEALDCTRLCVRLNIYLVNTIITELFNRFLMPHTQIISVRMHSLQNQFHFTISQFQFAMLIQCYLPEEEQRRIRRRSIWRDAALEDSEETVYSPTTKQQTLCCCQAFNSSHTVPAIKETALEVFLCMLKNQRGQ